MKDNKINIRDFENQKLSLFYDKFDRYKKQLRVYVAMDILDSIDFEIIDAFLNPCS